MDSSSMTFKESNTTISARVSNVTDLQLQQGLDTIKKGDAYRDRGDFDKAKAKYEKAARFCGNEAHDRLVILPLCKSSMENSDPDRFISAGWRARAHHAKEKVKQVWRHPSPTPSLKQSFFPRLSPSTKSTIASLAISDSQSTFMSVSTCATTSTSTSLPTTGAPSTITSETVASDLGTISDVVTLTAAYKTTDDVARGILEKKIYDIIKEFGECQIMTFDTVQELVVLADIHDRDIFLHIVTKILCVLRDMPLLSDIALQGLAVILDSFPDDVDFGSMQGAFVEILASLQGRLRVIRPSNNDLQVIPLLSALNALLDAMVRRKVFGLDREVVYNDLRTLLTSLTSHSNVMVCFQALYAKQALAIIGNDESLPMSIFRRGKLAFVLAGNVSNMATKFDLASAESAYQTIKDMFDISIQDRWYQGLIYVDFLVGQSSWWQFEDFVLHSKFQSDVCFLLGVVLRLEQVAVVQMDVTVRDGAIRLLAAIGENPIPLVPEMVQSTLRRLERLKSSTGGTMDVASPRTYEVDLRPVWDPAWLAAPKGILFKAVQDKDRRDATMENIPATLDTILQAVVIPPPSLEDVHSALRTYYERDLAILRVSGEKLDLESCFVNLAIVEAPAQREKDKDDLKKLAAVFHRIPSSEAVGEVNMQTSIPLEQLFNKRKLRDGKEDIPKTILVQGRAGVGKTTLCKKLVHAHQTGLWRDRFDTVLWLPLRQIKAFKARTLEDLFREKFFSQSPKKEGKALARALEACVQNHRVLFVLDGLDEIARDTRCEDGLSLRQFLETLLLQQHVVITSRPSGLDRSLLPPSIDLELETIGFNQQNVNDFVSKVLSPKAAKTVQDFIQQTPLIRGLVNIPVQLDVICFSWDSLPTEGLEITMTGLYQLMVRKLWCKDALRLRKSAEGETLTQEHISQLEPQEIDELMATEMQYLGYLAFKGLTNNHQIEFDERSLLNAFRDLKKYRTTVNNHHYPPQLLEMMKQTSFLHTADADLDDAGKNTSQQAWYFLHLTFQEYFAATWVAQHLQSPSPTGFQGYFTTTTSAHHQQQSLPAGMMTLEQAKAFVQEHKYNPRYEIMWWMVAGLLEGEALKDFFDLLQGAPRDLIGGRHQQILASCLNEARARLDTTVVTGLDEELMKWLHFEIQTCQDEDDKSMLGSRSSFPEALLVKNMGLKSVSKAILVNTLKARSTLSEAAIQILIGALQDEDADVRKRAASALGNQSTLSEAAVQSLIGALNDENADVTSTAAEALVNQSTLSEATIQFLTDALRVEDVESSSAKAVVGKKSAMPEALTQFLIGALKDEDAFVRRSAASLLGNQSTFSEAVIQSLTGALEDEDADVRSSATWALGKQSTLSEATIQSLIGALKDEDADVRRRAAEAVGKLSTLSEAAIQSLIGALMDNDADIRSSAASALGNQSTLSEAAVQSLIGALQDESAGVRRIAASAIGNQSTFSEAAIQPLFGALKDEDADVRSSAAEAVGKQSTLSEAVIQSLMGTLKDQSASVRSSAASALGKQSTLSEAAIQSLVVTLLKDEDPGARSSAASALVNQSTLSEVVIQSLIDALKNEDADVGRSAASILTDQSVLSEMAIQSLIDALQDEDADIRSRAASVLGNQPTLSGAATQSLMDTLKDADSDVRSSAAAALGKLATMSEETMQSLIGALNHENADVRSSAVSVLGRQSTLSEAVIQSLIGALKDDDAIVRTRTAWVLGNHGTLSEAAIQSLIGALKDENADVRRRAASALSNQSTLSEEAIQSLINALNHDNAYMRGKVESILRNQSMLSGTAIQSLVVTLKGENASVRSSATSVLGNQSSLTEAGIQSLIGALKDEDTEVRKRAASAFDNQSTLSEVAIQSLIGALQDEDAGVRRRAAWALGKQSTLSEATIQSLIVTLKDENPDVRRCVAQIFNNHCHSVCMALPGLSEFEIEPAYKDHLFHYSCRNVMSLHVQDNRLCYYTEQGLMLTEPVESNKATLITSAFISSLDVDHI